MIPRQDYGKPAQVFLLVVAIIASSFPVLMWFGIVPIHSQPIATNLQVLFPKQEAEKPNQQVWITNPNKEVSSEGLSWPVVSSISQKYGSSHPLGIDIDGEYLKDAPVLAATDGVVVFAGGNACCGYGLYVVLMSPDGIETVYGHMSYIGVVQKQIVVQKQALGIIGSTGYSTGRHLHFEVIDNGVRVDPEKYLPKIP